MHRVSDLVTRRPWMVIAAWLVVLGAVVAFAPKLSEATTADQSSFLPADTESAAARALAKQAFPDSPASSAVIVLTGRLDQQRVAALAAQLNDGKPAVVASVQPGPLSGDGKSVLLQVAFTKQAADPAVRAAVLDLRSELKDSGLNATMTGEPAIVTDNKQAFADAEGITFLTTFALIVLLMLVIFRSPVAVLLPLLSVGLAYGIAGPLIAIAAQAFDFRVPEEVPLLMTVVLFGIGTDYVLFLLFRYRDRLRAGDEPRQAVRTALNRVGEAISSAAIAVIAAFSVLLLAAFGFFSSFGPALAIATAVMLLVAMTFVPALLAVLGRAVFWPVRPAAPSNPRFFPWLGRIVSQRPKLVTALALSTLVAMAAGVLGYTANYDPVAQLPPKAEATRAYKDLTRAFPAGVLAPVEVYVHGQEITRPQAEALAAQLGTVPGVQMPLPPRLSGDGRTAVVPLVLAGDPYSGSALDLVSGQLRDVARATAPPGAEVVIGGQSMTFADMRAATTSDLTLILPLAALAFLLILTVTLRAVIAPLYLVVLVMLGFAATLGATSLMFGDLIFLIPIIIYLLVTAIGTDYNILMAARIREELRDGHDVRAAAARAIETTGPSVAAAAAILAGTFASLLPTGVPFFAQAGFALTLGILAVAFGVSVLLTPALAILTSLRKAPAGDRLDYGSDRPGLDRAASG